MTEQDLLQDLSRAKTAFHRSARRVDKIVEKWFLDQIDKDTLKLIGQANHDLHYGPLDERGYPGFKSAVREIKDALSDIPGTVWVDTEAEIVSESEPEGYEDYDGEWVEPMWEDYVEYDLYKIQRVALGELADYIR